MQFVSKQQAYAQQSSRTRRPTQLLGSNPLPDTFHVIPDNPGNVLAVRNALTPPAPGGGAKPLDPSIETSRNKKSDTKKILEVTNLVKITAAVLTVLLTLASMLLIANTIRLSLYARRREVEVMKLVGATDWFIRWPFVIEGVFVGAFGALLAIVAAGRDEGRAARSARQSLDADRRAADDRVLGARGCAHGRGGGGLGRRVGAVAAPLPAGVGTPGRRKGSARAWASAHVSNRALVLRDRPFAANHP